MSMNRTGHISADIFNRMRAFESPAVIDINSAVQQEQQQQQGEVNNQSGDGFVSDATNRIEDSALGNGRAKRNEMMSSSPPLPPPPSVQTDADGLILPKKLINPCLENTDRKELHRELKFNNKVGKSVLNQKSELQRVYDKQKERQQQHSQDQSSEGLKDELNRAILERAQKHELTRPTAPSDDDKQYVNPEYLNARAKLRAGRADLK